MTIDEAIKYYLDIADGQDKCAEISVSEHAKERISKCAANNRQLAEWLTKLKELEAKHWDECRQIAHYDDELKEAKRLLRLAIDDINAAEACDTCEYYPVINSDMCQKDDCYKWRYADEALKLLKGDTNE